MRAAFDARARLLLLLLPQRQSPSVARGVKCLEVRFSPFSDSVYVSLCAMSQNNFVFLTEM